MIQVPMRINKDYLRKKHTIMPNILNILIIYFFLFFYRIILPIMYIKHVDLGICLKQNLFFFFFLKQKSLYNTPVPGTVLLSHPP